MKENLTYSSILLCQGFILILNVAIQKIYFQLVTLTKTDISEIGQYYSSCASHYNSLIVYSLKNNEWKEIGSCIYDLYYMSNGKPFSYFVKKTGRGKFEMLEITDIQKTRKKLANIGKIFQCDKNYGSQTKDYRK
jgi:hypothetical protein